MADIERSGAAQFAQVVNKTMKGFTDTTEKTLAAGAARGFPAPPSADLDAIIMAGQAAKVELVDENAKIYNSQRQVLFDWQALRLRIQVALARLAMELYRVEIFNSLELEQAQIEQEIQEKRADVERWLAEIESRQVHIIQDRAKVEQSLFALQKELVATQKETLPMQRLLVEEQLKTAIKKLEIIDSIYKVLAAEQLVLVAERQRAASLQLVLQAHLIIAQIKKEMVPYYLQEADAEKQLAGAITQETEYKKKIELLGFDRIRLRWSEEEANHATRLAELDYEIARENKIRAEKALAIVKEHSKTLLQEYADNIRAQVLAIRKQLAKDRFDLTSFDHLARLEIQIGDDTQLVENQILNLSLELANLLRNLDKRAKDEDFTVRDTASTVTLAATTTATEHKQIGKG